MDDLIERVRAELTEVHGCHTVILYGSRARGDWTADSDVDVVGFRADGPPLRDARPFGGALLDAFVRPDAVDGRERELLHLRGGRILTERDGFGGALLRRIDEAFRQGPPPVAEDELRARRVWIGKMVARAARGDVEGHHRRAWLLFDLLESYFVLDGRWYLGPKESFRWLARHDPGAHGAFEAALRPGAPLADVEALARTVLGGWQPSLVGPTLRLRPMVEADLDPLHAVAADPLIWALHPDRERHTRGRFEVYFRSGMASGGALVVEDRASGAVIGASRYTDPDPATSSVEVGYTFLARSHWGGATNRELKALMLGHAFRSVDAVHFVVGRDNLRSRGAMTKLGAEELDDEAATATGRRADLSSSVIYRIRRSAWWTGPADTSGSFLASGAALRLSGPASGGGLAGP